MISIDIFSSERIATDLVLQRIAILSKTYLISKSIKMTYISQHDLYFQQELFYSGIHIFQRSIDNDM